MTIIDDYILFQGEFEVKYGTNTCLFMQIGDFFEVYSDILNCPKIKKIAEILDVVLSKKNKSITEVSSKNPHMLGFPIHNLNKYLTLLLDHGYTVPLIEQVTEAPNPQREVTKIFSPGTLVSDIKSSESNNLISLWIQEETCMITNNTVLCIGISIIDISIGNSYIYNFYNNDFDKILTELYQIIDKFYPKEIVLNHSDKNIDLINKIIERIDINNRLIHINIPPNIHLKLSYQTELLERIFDNKSMISIIALLNLDNKEYGLKSYTLLLGFVYEHNTNIIKKINLPDILNTKDNLLLHNNTLLQLNVIENKNIQINTLYKSLFHVINHTSTSLGKRLLKYHLLNPIFNIEELNIRYNNIEIMMNSDRLLDISNLLNNISDIERLHRKIALKTLHPNEFGNALDMSYNSIRDLLLIINDIYGVDYVNDELINEFNRYRDEYNSYFDMDEIVKYNLKNIKGSFFKKGIYLDVDNIISEINTITNYFDEQANQLSKIIDYKAYNVKVENNDRDGYFLCATNKRSETLKTRLGKTTEYKFKQKTASNMRITSNEIKLKSNKLIALQLKIKSIVYEYYISLLDEFYYKYSNLYHKLADIISNFDVIKSHVTMSQKYNYCKPTIIQSEHSFFDGSNIRHPIIERFDNNTKYVSNDMKLGDSQYGILLYGLNFSGKSSFLRSVGLAIIMAQSGMYVSASSFIYNPYHTFFTRISGDDNLFQGQSSFTVEMNDLRMITDYSNSNSIILADELCKGTEYSSSLALVASSVISLAQNGCNFIFTTHINELFKMKRINDISNIGHYHLHVQCNDDGTFIYDRKIRNGCGSDIYGIEVAKSIKVNKTIIDLAMVIRNEHLQISNIILNTKTSKYNSDVFIDKCQICNITYKEVEPSSLDVHHISQQKNADCHGMIDSFHKNERHNLIVLCKPCHIKTHQYNDTGIGINISHKIQTSHGVKIEWNLVNGNTNIKSKRCKYSNDDINIICSMKGKHLTQKNIIFKLKNEYNINISKSTLSKYLNNS
jgi:DNA mismatch repair protein MutS